MSNIQLSNNLSIPAVDYANQGNSIIGIRGSGKTYTATKVAEELMAAGVPIIAFDPTGVWQNLRHGTDKGKGFPIVVAGGLFPDLPLDEHNAVRIVEAALQERVSLVIDLQGTSTSNKSKWLRIVSECVEYLLANNQRYCLRHVFIEEAAEFIPQRPSPGGAVTYSRIESLARMGRNFGLGYTLINQRAEEIAKAVFEISELVLVHRQSGKNSLNSIRDWLQVRGQSDKDIVKTLPSLGNGECWAIDDKQETRISVLPKLTFHPDPKKGKTTPAAGTAADASGFIGRMSTLLAIEPVAGKEAGNKAPAAEVKRLEAQLAELRNLKNQAFDERDFYQKRLEEQGDYKGRYLDLCHRLKQLVPDDVFHQVQTPIAVPISAALGEHGLEFTKKVYEKVAAAPPSKAGSGATRMLKAAAQFHPKAITKMRMAALAGMKHSSGTFSNYLSQLRQSGFIEVAGDRQFKATAAGVKEAGAFEPLPTDPTDLVEMWCGVIGNNSGAARMLRELFKTYPNALKKAALAGQVNMSAGSGTFSNYLSILRKNGLITETKTGIKAADELFN